MGELKDKAIGDIVTYRFPKRNITKIQRKYLEFIESFYNENDRLPTLDDIADFFGVAKSTVHQNINRNGMRYHSRIGLILT